MRWLGLVVLAPCCALLAEAGDKARSFHFLKDDLGKVPSGWTAAQTGKGKGSVWKVVADQTAPSKKGVVLAQTARSPGPLFNLCVADEPALKNIDLSVAFKAVEGKIDQGGGPVWRYQDANNYYIARANPLEENFRLYKVVGGKRVQLASKDAPTSTGRWHTLRVVHDGDKIKCYLDGKLHLEATDKAIQEAGKVGLWTKADAQTFFNNLAVQPAKRE
jgi:hypothetical protein